MTGNTIVVQSRKNYWEDWIQREKGNIFNTVQKGKTEKKMDNG